MTLPPSFSSTAELWGVMNHLPIFRAPHAASEETAATSLKVSVQEFAPSLKNQGEQHTWKAWKLPL